MSPADGSTRLSGLMRDAQAGDGRAYAQLLRELAPLLRRVVVRRWSFLDEADVEDLVQEILLSVHAVRATYDPARPFLPWMLAITRNRMADAARRYRRRASREVALEELDVTFAAASSNTGSEDDRRPDSEALRRAVDELPAGQRQAIVLLKLKEMSLREAAAETGLSIGALKVAAHRAILALRRKLTTRGDDGPDR